MRNLSRLCACLLLPALLAACGAKGPLFLPEPAPAPEEDASAVPESPGEQADGTPPPLAVTAAIAHAHG